MAALDDLLSRIEDKALRADIERELEPLRAEQQLGLVFERHLPEKVRLYDLPVRRGATVEVRADLESPTWQVKKITGQTAQLQRREHNAVLHESRSVEDLVVVREFGDPIYPGLKQVDEVKRGGDKPSHVVIDSENFHALETLLYTCEGQVDAIYIDPPYNSGARDWKYNNDYVDLNDRNRHSKWLSFMEKRLRLAKRLLAPAQSVLIVTVDEREVHRLGILLSQVFPQATQQMITIVINHRGSARAREFTRVEEYAFFVFIGDGAPSLVRDDLLSSQEVAITEGEVRWERLIKGSNGALRADRPNLFYPVFVDPQTRNIALVGEAIPADQDRTTVKVPDGLTAVWPISRQGTEKRWQVSPSTLRELLKQGFARVGSFDRKNDRWSIQYLNRGQRERIERGEIEIIGRDQNGVFQLRTAAAPRRAAMTVWNRLAHNAGYYGSGIVSALLPGRKFPFPKSLYAVEDCLRFAVGDQPGALILDFFAGSGTTAHAVMRLNRQDGGHRRSILVTNNEVGVDEQRTLSARGLQPGDADWEALGICEYFTIPRIKAAVTGMTPEGEPVKGTYKFTDEFPMAEGFEENVEFYKLTYEERDLVQLGVAFESIAPLLWLRAGARGSRIREMPAAGWGVPHGGRYGVLFDANVWPEFTAAVKASHTVTHAFVVTDSDAVFQQVVDDLPDEVESVRLYESYLTSFAVNRAVMP